MRNNSDTLLLFTQTLRDIESMYKDIGDYEMKYDESKKLCSKAWSEKFNYLCIDRTEKNNEGNCRILNENKNTYIESFCEKEAF